MFEEFKTDQEIIEFLISEMNKITKLTDCTLYKEEQINFILDKRLMRYRNCIEWIARSNDLIENIKYSLQQSLKYGLTVDDPLAITKDKKKCSYYLENAIYREIVFWDIFRQFLNELYDCGYTRKKNINIFEFLNNKKIPKKTRTKIIKYLKEKSHSNIRKKLRNSFAHSIDPTTLMVFHDENNGIVRPEIDLAFLTHPFTNIFELIKDLKQLMIFFNEHVTELENVLAEEYMLYKVIAYPSCKLECELEGVVTRKEIKNEIKNAYIECQEKCDKKIGVGENKKGCKPKKFEYYRIEEPEKKKTIILKKVGL